MFLQVVIVLTGSQQPFAEHMEFTQSLMGLIVEEMLLIKPESIKFIFGDNIRFLDKNNCSTFLMHVSHCRGLLQQVCFEKLMVKSCLKDEIQSVTLSSVHQMSKVLNSAADGRQLRY